MPFYDFICDECGNELEIRFPYNSTIAVTCGTCGSKMRKKITAVSVRFKGSGWASKDETHNEAGERLIPRKPKDD